MNHSPIYTERIEIKVSKDMKKIIEKLAKQYNTTMNEIVRQAISEMWEKI